MPRCCGTLSSKPGSCVVLRQLSQQLHTAAWASNAWHWQKWCLRSTLYSTEEDIKENGYEEHERPAPAPKPCIRTFLSLPILCDKCCGNSSCCCSSPPHLWRRTASKQMATEMNTEGLCLQRWDHSDKPVLRTALCRGSSDIAASLDVGSAASTDPGLQHCPQPCWGSSNLETGRRVSSTLCRMTALQA